MNDRFADLHIHTNFSDSTASPQEVVMEASAAGLCCIAIADHDTVDAFPETLAAAESARIELLAGVELSSEYEGKDIHILGYCFDLKDSPLVDQLHHMQQARIERMKKMISKLQGLGKRDITLEDVAHLTRSDSLGRLHLAKLLVARGHVRSIDEAFEKYLGEGAAAYFPKYKQTPLEAIKLIRDSGGVAVMAHPVLTNRDALIPMLVEAGLGGIEAHYPNSSMVTVNRYMDIARQYDLVVTGGSDAHGAAKTSTFIGKAYVPYHWVEVLKSRAGKRA
ncbi:MAG: PHP domain-containing protein [Candidatus Omnitrophica bacterium]|nr:PHP domain-containing protein [Candidatus Omnitrophota bacterium]